MFDLHLGSRRKVCADVGRRERLCEFAVVSSAFQGALWNTFHQPNWPIANLHASECVHLLCRDDCRMIFGNVWFCFYENLWYNNRKVSVKMTALKLHVTDVVKKKNSWTLNRIYVRTVHWSPISTSQESTASRSTESCMSPTMSSLLHHQKVQPALWSSWMSIRRERNTYGEQKRWYIMFVLYVCT